MKRNKAPGPDEITMEVFKEMDEENNEYVLEVINEWWEKDEVPEEETLARVVLIYKKGDASLCENYRPISLLNSMYKIIAARIR